MPINFVEITRNKELAQAERDRQFKRETPLIPVVLTDISGQSVDGSGVAVSAVVIGNENFVWARAYNESIPSQYLNVRGIPPIGGTPCQAGYAEGSTQIEILQINDINPSATRTTPRRQQHAFEHLPGNWDPLDVVTRMLVELRTSAGGGLKVNIAPKIYTAPDGTLGVFGGYNNFDLTSNLPASGLAQYTLVYLDPSTGTIDTTDGTTTTDTPSIEPTRPTPTDGTYPSAWVRLAGGQTQIEEVRDIRDARLIVGEFGVQGNPVWTNWTPTVTQSGSVTIGTPTYCEYKIEKGLAFTWGRLPVTGSGTLNNAIVIGGVPAAIQPTESGDDTYIIGECLIKDNGTLYYHGALVAVGASDWRIIAHGLGNYVGITPNFGLANGDEITFKALYRVS